VVKSRTNEVPHAARHEVAATWKQLGNNTIPRDDSENASTVPKAAPINPRRKGPAGRNKKVRVNWCVFLFVDQVVVTSLAHLCSILSSTCMIASVCMFSLYSFTHVHFQTQGRAHERARRSAASFRAGALRGVYRGRMVAQHGLGAAEKRPRRQRPFTDYFFFFAFFTGICRRNRRRRWW